MAYCAMSLDWLTRFSTWDLVESLVTWRSKILYSCIFLFLWRCHPLKIWGSIVLQRPVDHRSCDQDEIWTIRGIRNLSNPRWNITSTIQLNPLIWFVGSYIERSWYLRYSHSIHDTKPCDGKLIFNPKGRIRSWSFTIFLTFLFPFISFYFP